MSPLPANLSALLVHATGSSGADLDDEAPSWTSGGGVGFVLSIFAADLASVSKTNLCADAYYVLNTAH